MVLDPNNPLHIVPAALATHPGMVVVLPVFTRADMEEVVRRYNTYPGAGTAEGSGK